MRQAKNEWERKMAFAEVSENHKKIQVWFPYNPAHVAAMKTLGGKFVPKERGGPYWEVALDISIARRLREVFGTDLNLGKALKAWGHRLVNQERQLKLLSTSDSAELVRLPELLPDLYRKLHVGPRAKFMKPDEVVKAMNEPSSYQAADVAFGVVQRNPFNGNEPGLGKTLETIGSIFEAGADIGPMLVVAPKTALNTVWESELVHNQPHPVFVATGSKRESVFDRFKHEIIDAGKPGWLIVNPELARVKDHIVPCRYHAPMKRTVANKRDMKSCPDCLYEEVSLTPLLHETQWQVLVLDEVHRMGIRSIHSQTYRGLMKLKSTADGKRFALSATPMGGRIINLYPILHWLNPDVFSSKWRFAGTWCDLTPNRYSKMGEIGDSIRHCDRHKNHDDASNGRPDCDECRRIEADFYAMLQPYMIRRTKSVATPWLPPKDFIEVWCAKTTKQEKQYLKFAADAKVNIQGGTVTVTSILAEFTRLRQFAFGVCELREDGKVVPTEDSGKLEAIAEKLEEFGIMDGEGDEQVVIFSQFSEVVELIYRWLKAKGVPVAKLTGATKQKDRESLQEQFQSDGRIRVLVMTTTAGGVSITLDRASTVFMVDETWNPDDQLQAEDRVHRVSRIHQVTVYVFRTVGSIDEYILEVTSEKAAVNASVMELRRVRLV